MRDEPLLDSFGHRFHWIGKSIPVHTHAMKNLCLPQVFALAVSAWLVSGCGLMNRGTTIQSSETAEASQEVGDVMASIDESGGSTGSISYRVQDEAAVLFARADRHRPNAEIRSILNTIGKPVESAFNWFPNAEAFSCLNSVTYGGCSGGDQRTRSFSGCTFGSLVLNGTITDRWNISNNCHLSSIGDTITRVPSYTVTRTNGDILTVSKTGTVGQRITWSGGSVGISQNFKFSNDGIKRSIASGATTLYDFTTTTTSDLQFTGSDRSANSGTNVRIMSGGTLHVYNSLTTVDCSFSPNAVAWNSSCTCAVSGTWSGSCSNGKTHTLQITGCGTGTLTVSGSSNFSVVFDRCSST